MTACMIYVIRCGDHGPYKIGRARDAGKRLVNLQSAHHEQLHLVGVLSGHDCDESGLHEVFAATRIRGEWFAASELMSQLLAAFTEGHGREWIDARIDAINAAEFAVHEARRKETAKEMLARLARERADV